MLAVALWYWLLAFVLAPRLVRSPRGKGAGLRLAAHVAVVALLFGLVHALNHLAFVKGIQISVWSELDFAVICHAMAWLLWVRGPRPQPRAAGTAR